MSRPNSTGSSGLPRLPIPGLSGLQDLVGLQAQAMAQLPVTVAELNRAVAELTQVIEAARTTIETAHQVSQRLDRATRELEQPVRDLRPGIERLARVLDDPTIDEIPRTLKMIGDVVEPINNRVRQSQDHAASVSAAARSVARAVRRLPARAMEQVRRRRTATRSPR